MIAYAFSLMPAKRSCLIDFSHGSCEEVHAGAQAEVQSTVRPATRFRVDSWPTSIRRRSIKTLLSRMKQVLVLDRPFVKRSAWIGTESLPKIFYENFKSFSQREISHSSRRAKRHWSGW